MTQCSSAPACGAVRVVVARFLCKYAVQAAAVARALRVDRSTVGRWCVAPGSARTGRPRWRASLDLCCRVLKAIFDQAGRITLRALKKLFPQASRSWLADVSRRCARVRSARRRARLAKLRWTRPGTVWAVDFTALEGRGGPCALYVRDLAARKLLHASVVESESAASVHDVLARLFDRHGAPLVLKSDNGSAFRSEVLRAELDLRQVVPLFSPPRTPAYNGACESGIGVLKRVAEDLRAAYAPHAGLAAFLPDTMSILDAQPLDRRHDPRSRAEVWQSRRPCTRAIRARFQALCHAFERRHRELEGIDAELALPHHAQASLDRRAIRDALCEMNLLIIQKP